MSFFIIPITALVASLLTFFSGFGLGTILLPVFAMYYDAPIAVGLTAIVHFSNNVFKMGLVYKNINWNVFFKFGIPSLVSAFIGALALTYLFAKPIILTSYYLTLTELTHNVTLFNVIVGLLIIIFSLFEIVPYLKNLSFSENKLTVGGLLSGFFGGLSGHQGALRSAFLVRLNLPKESYVATGTAIACVVDVARMSIYALTFNFTTIKQNYSIIIIAVLAAFVGALIGNKLLKKTTLGFLKWFVTVFMILIALLMMLGLIG